MRPTHGTRAKVTGSRMPTPPVLLAACFVALFAGCSSGSHTASTATTHSANTTVSPTVGATTAAPTPTRTSPLATPSLAAPPVASPTSTGGKAPCPTRALATKNGGSQGAAGSTYLSIDFSNITGASCTLYGYPGVSFAGNTPVQQIGVAADHSASPAKTLVTLAPGQVSHVLLRISNASFSAPSQCDPVTSTSLQIYPPNQTTPIYFAYTSSACRKPIHLLTVSAMQAGP